MCFCSSKAPHSCEVEVVASCRKAKKAGGLQQAHARRSSGPGWRGPQNKELFHSFSSEGRMAKDDLPISAPMHSHTHMLKPCFYARLVCSTHMHAIIVLVLCRASVALRSRPSSSLTSLRPLGLGRCVRHIRCAPPALHLPHASHYPNVHPCPRPCPCLSVPASFAAPALAPAPFCMQASCNSVLRLPLCKWSLYQCVK